MIVFFAKGFCISGKKLYFCIIQFHLKLICHEKDHFGNRRYRFYWFTHHG